MTFRYVQLKPESDGVAVITICRPEKRNALNREIIAGLSDVFDTVAADRSIRGLVLTGEGGKAFAAGADVAELAALNAPQAEALSRFGQGVFRKLETLRKPSVAALNGAALGGGLELAMCCTVRFAVPEALLGQPEVKLGTMPGYGATQRLPRLVGRGRALEMLLSGEPVTAADALSMGLVNRVVPAAGLLTEARAWLAKCLAHGTYAMALTMEAVDAGLDGGLEAGLRFEAAAFGLVASSEDRAEGMRAFLEKRGAKFTGS